MGSTKYTFVTLQVRYSKADSSQLEKREDDKRRLYIGEFATNAVTHHLQTRSFVFNMVEKSLSSCTASEG